MNSSPNQFDDWYEDEHGTAMEDCLDEDANELDIDPYYTEWNEI